MSNEEDKVMPDLNQSDIQIADGIDAAMEPDDNLIRLSTGVILEAHKANPNMLIRAMTSRPRPQPPVYFNKSMGREMENPDDPDYIKRAQAYEMEYSSATLNVLVALGTALKKLPKGVEGPDGDDWIADYDSMGLPTHPESKSWRYITWVLFKAAPSDTDTKLIMNKVGRLSGVRDTAVKAAQSFPGRD